MNPLYVVALDKIRRERDINTIVYYIAENISNITYLNDKIAYYPTDNSCDIGLHDYDCVEARFLISVNQLVAEDAISIRYDDDGKKIFFEVKSLEIMCDIVSCHYSKWFYV